MKRQISLWFTAVVFTLLSVGLAYAQVPIIIRLLSACYIIVTSVTITRTSINASAGQNIVFFGATKPTMTAASTISV